MKGTTDKIFYHNNMDNESPSSSLALLQAQGQQPRRARNVHMVKLLPAPPRKQHKASANISGNREDEPSTSIDQEADEKFKEIGILFEQLLLKTKEIPKINDRVGSHYSQEEIYQDDESFQGTVEIHRVPAQ